MIAGGHREAWSGPGGTEQLQPFDKGVPGTIAPLAVADVGEQGWNLLAEDIPLPAAVLKESALRKNALWMRDFIAGKGVEIAPHGKTTMAPHLFDLQMRDGAWGITLSTPHQIAVALAAGHRRIFVANQIVGRAGIGYILALLDADPALEIYCLIDSVPLLRQIEAVARRQGAIRALPLLVEMGFAGGRTGVRTVEQGLDVARAVAASEHAELVGVEGFEGIIRKGDVEQTLRAVEDFLADVVSLAQACDDEHLFARATILLSAGGSAFFDLVVSSFERATLTSHRTILLRSGCYITHDAGLYRLVFTLLKMRAPDLFANGEPEAALEVWGYVQSCPEPGRMIVTLGKRDIGFDDMPVPERWFRPGTDMAAPAALSADHRVVALNDQHGFLDVPTMSPLAVGDLVGFGISHPCLTFDKWRVIHLVDDAYNITGSMRTYF
jgi:D-serine dehydratase